ncbi:MAG: ribokinase [Fimbriimonadaceae bacterium]|nr:ribokinase [Fimbriimonadaceae bacterium]
MAHPLTVIVSCSMDFVWRVPEFPTPGASKQATFARFPGGKGANQAIQAARLGASVTAIGCVGDEIYGHELKQLLIEAGIDAAGVRLTKDTCTAMAGILVNAEGQNMISIDFGANLHLNAEDVKAYMPRDPHRIVLCQLEVTDDVVIEAAQHGRLLLNPAPARLVPETILRSAWMVTPNQEEAAHLTGLTCECKDDAPSVAAALLEMGPEHAVLTLGSEGAYWASKSGNSEFIPTTQVVAVDTVAAGDSLNGSLAAFLSEGALIPDALFRACRVASVSVTRHGAIPSLPTRSEMSALGFPV